MHTVTIYSTPSCVYCKMAKEYFTEHQVAYTEKNVLIDLSAREEMVKKSGQLGVPVIDIDGQVIVGFDRPALEKLLAA
ncbi:MAG: Glutaredoxin-like protein, YruB-family [Candidatus Giovannonibacteria bacterium GW2011_GWA2_53_7]|uniref:Glutaredoxin-like protein, YruB-family n=1 Tax=Candidatus Giovannonibacteria bacterium GW2011_GWA2_53_7 TaxID=1618650 RepID=A0A0G1XTF7_9BACT|nr:MAG: Glutaredoxin-like protein, YruB-family [Candidatus Giovannonibacteria bacterium GW2011_GWA2_53_7]